MKSSSTMRTVASIFAAGVLLTSCVSSKKYKASQAEVAKLHADSTALAQEKSSLQQNLSTAEQKGTDLQKSVESANTANASLKQNVAYYGDYATKQESSTKQIKDELSTSLVAAGLTEQDILQIDGKIYINIGEKGLFKGNTAVLSTKGKEMIDNLGEYVKGHEAVDVSVADLQQAAVETAPDGSGTGNTTTTNQSATTATTTADQANTPTTSSTSGTYAKAKSTAPKKTWKRAVANTKKVSGSGESKSTTYSSGKKISNNKSVLRAMAWKRQNVVADQLLKNGIPKVKLVSQLQPGTNSQKGVQVVLVNDMDNFYKHMSEAPAAGQPVSKNP